MTEKWLVRPLTVEEWTKVGEDNRGYPPGVVVSRHVHPHSGHVIDTAVWPLDPNIQVTGPIPFGERYFTYRMMLLWASKSDKDVVWEFDSGQESFGQLSGRSGYVLVRRGMVASGYSITTRMS
jgi:hypothetical protein